MGQLFLQSLRRWLQIIILHLSKPFSNIFWEILGRGKSWPNLMSHYRPYIPNKCHVLANVFTTLRQGCGNVTIRLWIIHIWRSSQSWARIGAALQYQRREDVVKLTSQFYRRREDFVKLTSRFQRCVSVVSTTFMIYCELSLPCNSEATLKQRYNFDVVASTLKYCILVVR